MRFDAAITTLYQILVRHSQPHVPPFKEWALLQFRGSPRHPAAAVAALDDMMLVPEDAVTAILNLFGETD
jgi:hypothetical protein